MSAVVADHTKKNKNSKQHSGTHEHAEHTSDRQHAQRSHSSQHHTHSRQHTQLQSTRVRYTGMGVFNAA